MTQEQSLFVTTPKGNVHAGDLRDGVLVKYVDRKSHFLRNWQSYAVQKSVLENPELNAVEIHEKGGKVLRANVALWQDYGRRLNLGHGEQVALEERFFNVSK